jgi:hypothetical protein
LPQGSEFVVTQNDIFLQAQNLLGQHFIVYKAPKSTVLIVDKDSGNWIASCVRYGRWPWLVVGTHPLAVYRAKTRSLAVEYLIECAVASWGA